MRSVLFSLLILCLVSGSALATDPYHGTSYLSHSITDSLVYAYIVPDGSGCTMDSYRNDSYQTIDCTIDVYLNDVNGDPVANFPAEDIRLGCMGYWPSATICDNSPLSDWIDLKVHADSDTDANGHTTISGAIPGGGMFHPYMVWGDLFVNIPYGSNSFNLLVGAVLEVNSPDYDGDLQVTSATDLIYFQTDYTGPYNFRSDFYYDGQITLSDVIIFSRAMNTSCQ